MAEMSGRAAFAPGFCMMISDALPAPKRSTRSACVSVILEGEFIDGLTVIEFLSTAASASASVG